MNLLVAVGCFAAASVRYLLMVGLYYAAVYRVMREPLGAFKINKQDPTPKMMGSEIFWGLLNNVNFAVVGVVVYEFYKQGWLRVFLDFEAYPWIYHLLLVPVLLLLHDAYFFWIHWAMHKTRLGRWLRHDVHHGAHNVSPWSAFSVHPFEGLLEVAFRLITLMAIPMHPLDFLFFEILTFALNIIGHSGYEFFPRNFATSPVTRMKSCATFHYMHHQNGGTNLSLFFNHWDRLMGTLNPDYEKFYAQVMKERRPWRRT